MRSDFIKPCEECGNPEGFYSDILKKDVCEKCWWKLIVKVLIPVAAAGIAFAIFI